MLYCSITVYAAGRVLEVGPFTDGSEFATGVRSTLVPFVEECGPGTFVFRGFRDGERVFELTVYRAVSFDQLVSAVQSAADVADMI